MRLVPKLAMALLAGVFLVVAIFTAWRVRGELAEFDRDIRRDHRVIGLTAAAAVSHVPTREDAVRLVESGMQCTPGQVSMNQPQLVVEALVALPKPDEAQEPPKK